MELPKNVTKLYIRGDSLNINSLAFVCGKHNIYVNRVTMMNKNSAIVEVRFDSENDIKELIQDKTFRVKRIFKSMKIKKEDENKTFKTKDGKELPVLIGFVSNTTMNLLGQLNGKKLKITLHSNKNSLKKLFLDTMMKIRNEKKFDMLFEPEGNINFYIKRIEAKDKVYFVTWVTGNGFSN